MTRDPKATDQKEGTMDTTTTIYERRLVAFARAFGPSALPVRTGHGSEATPSGGPDDAERSNRAG